MPSGLPLLTVDELRRAFHDGIRARSDKRSDRVSGAIYDLFAGTCAVLLSREAQRDKDLFGADYFDTAKGDDLTNRGSARYGIDRILDAYGTGTCVLARPTAGDGAGTIWNGTRIQVVGNDRATYYRTTADVQIGAAALTATLPVRATSYGPGPAISSTTPSPNITVDDELFDNTFAVQALVVAPGTTFEDAAAYKARVRQTRITQRVGYEDRIIAAAKAAGAVYVALFRSDVGSPDLGLNACYVGDASYTCPDSLLRAVTVALESVRVCGADLFVRPMTTSARSFNADVHLWDNPGKFDTVALAEELAQAICGEFVGTTKGFGFRLDALAGEMGSRSEAVQSVVWNAPSADATILVGSPPHFPDTLTRYTARPEDITLNFLPPLPPS